MGQAVDQAKQERELTKRALASTLDRFEERVRSQLDWKARLRRDGIRYAVVGGGAAALVAGAVVLRLTILRPRRGITEEVHRRIASIDEIAEELRDLRKQLKDNRNRPEKDTGPLWQKVMLRGAAAGGAAAGTFVARRYLEGRGSDAEEAAHAAAVAVEKAKAS